VTFNGIKHNAQGNGEFVLADFTTTDCGKVEVHVCHKATTGNAETNGVSQNFGVSIKSSCGTAKFVSGKSDVFNAVKSGFTRSGNKVTFPGGSYIATGGNRAVTVVIAHDVCNADVFGLCYAYKMSDGSQYTIQSGQTYKWGGPYMGDFQQTWVSGLRSTTHFEADECPGSTGVDTPPQPFADCPDLYDDALEKCPPSTGLGKWVRESCIADIGLTCKLEPWVTDAKEAVAGMWEGETVACSSGADGRLCRNGGTPQGNIPSCSCRCPTGWKGTHCETSDVQMSKLRSFCNDLQHDGNGWGDGCGCAACSHKCLGRRAREYGQCDSLNTIGDAATHKQNVCNSLSRWGDSCGCINPFFGHCSARCLGNTARTRLGC